MKFLPIIAYSETLQRMVSDIRFVMDWKVLSTCCFRKFVLSATFIAIIILRCHPEVWQNHTMEMCIHHSWFESGLNLIPQTNVQRVMLKSKMAPEFCSAHFVQLLLADIPFTNFICFGFFKILLKTPCWRTT